MTSELAVSRLPHTPDIASEVRQRVERDYLRFAQTGLPEHLEQYLRDEYQLDVSTLYAGLPISNPWGKASGQLSMTAQQVAEDVEAGLGFVVLKTVIAQDESGGQSMQAWSVKESRMRAERIVGASGEEGWTISWKGRGWWQTFEEYLQLVSDARELAAGRQTLIVPSCKYHLPTPDETNWKISEYEYTTRKLFSAWTRELSSRNELMPLEKDFSPTLAGSDHATMKNRILEWLNRVPQLIRSAFPPEDYVSTNSPETPAAQSQAEIRVGLKIFNALFDDEFQLEMLRTIHSAGPSRPDYFVYGNRLFDPNRTFDGHRGIAYGGPDLSDRNLRVMSRFQNEVENGRISQPLLEWSATGNITTGKMAMEYALRGASSFQLHTFFQLPASQYSMRTGTKTCKALHELYFHPQTGMIVWLHHLAKQLQPEIPFIRFSDFIGRSLNAM